MNNDSNSIGETKSVKPKQNLLGTAIFIVVILIIAALVASLSYYYLVMRPNIIASYNFMDKDLLNMTIKPGYEASTKLDATAIKYLRNISGVKAVSPLQSYPAEVRLGANTGESVVYAIDPNYLPYENITLFSGKSAFSSTDANEAIVSTGTLKTIKTDASEILGKNLVFNLIKLDNDGAIEAHLPYSIKIVGIIKDDNTKFAYLPLNLIDKTDGTSYNEARLTVAKRDDMVRVRRIVEAKGFPTLSTYDSYEQVLEMTKNPVLYYYYQRMLSN